MAEVVGKDLATASTLFIACGALSRELVELKRLNQWHGVKIQCLPAHLHNSPDEIPAAVEAVLDATHSEYEQIFVAYADCGTGGRLDQVLERYDVARLPGAHCYEFYAGSEQFLELAEQQPGTFYLTDFLVRHFDRLVRQELGLDRHPSLKNEYFRHYRRVVYLAQTQSDTLLQKAKQQAKYLGLNFESRYTGLSPLDIAIRGENHTWQN